MISYWEEIANDCIRCARELASEDSIGLSGDKAKTIYYLLKAAHEATRCHDEYQKPAERAWAEYEAKKEKTEKKKITFQAP